ncbi:hypothetical protein [Pseudomonas sp. SMV7]
MREEMQRTGSAMMPAAARLHLLEKACTIAGFTNANQITRCKALNV